MAERDLPIGASDLYAWYGPETPAELLANNRAHDLAALALFDAFGGELAAMLGGANRSLSEQDVIVSTVMYLNEVRRSNEGMITFETAEALHAGAKLINDSRNLPNPRLPISNRIQRFLVAHPETEIDSKPAVDEPRLETNRDQSDLVAFIASEAYEPASATQDVIKPSQAQRSFLEKVSTNVDELVIPSDMDYATAERFITLVIDELERSDKYMEKKFSPRRIDQLRKVYIDGRTMIDLAAEYGTKQPALHNSLKRAVEVHIPQYVTNLSNLMELAQHQDNESDIDQDVDELVEPTAYQRSFFGYLLNLDPELDIPDDITKAQAQELISQLLDELRVALSDESGHYEDMEIRMRALFLDGTPANEVAQNLGLTVGEFVNIVRKDFNILSSTLENIAGLISDRFGHEHELDDEQIDMAGVAGNDGNN